MKMPDDEIRAIVAETLAEQHRLQQDSIDAGQSFSLPDAYDRDARFWDARGFILRRGFDTADRPLFVRAAQG